MEVFLSRFALIFLVLFFLMKVVTVWYGFDRLPLVAIQDEIIFNNPAIHLIRGEGLLNLNSPQLGKIEEFFFGYYPPLYTLLQAAIFHIFGVSTLTLRGANILFFIVYLFLAMVAMIRLKRLGIMDNFGFSMALIFLLADPTGWYYSRSGRPESLGIFLGMASLLFIIWSGRVSEFSRSWFLAGILMGFSLATHLEMFGVYLVYLAATVHLLKKKNFKLAAISCLLPILIYFLIWVGVHGQYAFKALLQQLRLIHILSTYTDYLRGPKINFILRSLMKKDISAFLSMGGVAYLVVLFSWLFLFLRIIFLSRFKTKTDYLLHKGWLYAFGLIALVHLCLINFVFGTATQRILPIYPITLVGLGIALSHLEVSLRIKKIAFGLMGLVALGGFLGHGLCLFKTYCEWQSRDPHRFSGFVRGIPLEKKVAAVYPLWFEFVKNRRLVTVVESTGTPKYLDYLVQEPSLLNQHDLIVLFKNSKFTQEVLPLLSHRSRKDLTFGNVDFIVLQ